MSSAFYLIIIVNWTINIIIKNTFFIKYTNPKKKDRIEKHSTNTKIKKNGE